MSWNSGFNNPLITWVAEGAYSNLSIKLNYVGGKIFYIDSTANGATYTFYDSSYNIISDIQVGDEPYYYIIKGTPSQDKYYIFNDEKTSSQTEWTYHNGSIWVYQTTGTSDGIGAGKTNTNIVMNASSGAYPAYSGNIWNYLQLLNESSSELCHDWYIPSKTELETLRTATDRSGNALTTHFTGTSIWSSTESASSAQYVKLWSRPDARWIDFSKNTSESTIPIRSF